MTDTLNVHGIRIQDATFLTTGGSSKVRRLTFYVGTHGPFIHDFPIGDDTAQAIQQTISKQVQELRTIVNTTY